MVKTATPAADEVMADKELDKGEVYPKEPVIKGYEVMVMINATLRENEAKKELETLAKWVDKNKGRVTVNDFWGKRPLAYRIKGQNEAYYGVVNCELNADRSPAMHKMLRLEKGVVRYLMTVLPEGYTYINYLKNKETAEAKMAKKEEDVAAVVVEKKVSKKSQPEPMVEMKKDATMAEEMTPATKEKPAAEPIAEAKEEKMEEKTEKGQKKMADEPVDKDLDAKLDKILGGDLSI